LEPLQEALGSQYTLEHEIGRGGMATVYLAHDTKHNRPVALKVLHATLTTTVGAERFRREISVAAALHHPHILTVLDSGATPSGQLWFTMPYVAGSSLAERLARDGTLPVAEALRVARQTADALDYAHRHGVIHRDIKPENIMLSGDHALVADFGIARLLPEGTDAEGDTLTVTGVAIGTLGYMSPEQASGLRMLDARTDVYSLGVVLYEMLAGESPFTRPISQTLIATMISAEPPSIRLVRPGVPERVDAALRKALAPVPGERWASAAEFADALQTSGVMAALAPVRRRRTFIAALVVGCALLIGAGAVVVWRSKRFVSRSTTTSRVLRLAVLPFENVGDSSDAYFADGVTDAVRGKLAGLPGLEVIGSTSSAQYRHTAKTPQEIGRELGVRYLLEGKVRWAKEADGTSHVRVSPELVDVGTAADAWDQPFDAPLTDVFQMQSTIAGQVAQELAIALTPAAEQALASQPTKDLAAYDDYLRGEALATAGGGPDVVHRHIAYFEDAVRRDSNFAMAWAALARAQSEEYFDGVPTPALADSANRNSARALALAPDLPDAQTARAAFCLRVHKDPVLALHHDSLALASAPRDARTLWRTGDVEETLGHWDAAEAHMRDAVRLDPRSVPAALDLGHLELLRRHQAEAQAALEHASALAPTTINVIEDNVQLALSRGDLAGGRALLRSVPSTVDRNAVIAFVAAYGDLGWALDTADATRLLALGPDAFGGDRGSWAFVRMQQYAFRGDQRRARAYADTARAAFAAQLESAPADAQRHALLGLTLAYLGRRDAAIREGRRGAELLPIARDAVLGPYIQHQLVRIYIVIGEPERALDALEPLLVTPYVLTPGMLRIDPNFAPLRGNPRFARLAAGGVD
jgi:serine/threonine-protein kinase